MKRSKLPIIIGVLLIIALPILIRLVGIRVGYLTQVYTIIPIWIIAGLSLTIITGYVGEISLAQSALMGIAAYTSAILTTKGAPIALAVVSALIAAMIGAIVLGIPTLRLRGPYFVVASMAFNGIFHEVVVNWIELTRGPNGISGVPTYSKIVFIGPYIPWILALVCLYLVWRLSQTRFGKSMMAVRDDELAASAIGLRVEYIKSLAFIISGLIAGIAGILLGHQIGYISPEAFTINQSIFILTMVLIGGVRQIPGVIVGAFLMVGFQEVLRSFPHVQLLFYGLMMLVVIIFVPHGIMDAINQRTRK